MNNRTRNRNRTRRRSRCLSIGVLIGVALAACTGSSRDDGPPADPVQDPPPAAPVDYADLHAAVCEDLTNSFECARAIEARQLPDSDAERSGDTLTLALEGGDSVQLVDVRGDASDVVHYSYQMRWAELGLVLVQVQYWEGSEYLLVDRATGERTRLPHWPLLGPEGRRFAVLSFDLEAGYGPNTLQIWDLGSGTPALEWSVEPEDWGPAEGRWENPTTLWVLRRGYCEAGPGPGRDFCDRPARVVLDEAGWALEADDG